MTATKPARKPKAVGVANFRTDPLYPRIERAVASILAKGGKVVAPVDVLVAMQLLTPENLVDWRRGRIPYLEQVIQCNLSRLSRLLRILRFHAHDLNLVPSHTAYHRHGKGPKQALRFSRTGDPNLEAAYSRHFVWPGKHAPGVLRPKPAATPAPTDETMGNDKISFHINSLEVLQVPAARRSKLLEGK
jgi:hypothetical protein